MQFWGVCPHEQWSAGHASKLIKFCRDRQGWKWLNGFCLIKHVETPVDIELLICLSLSSMFGCPQRLKQQELPSEFTFQPERGNANFILSCSPLFRIDENISDRCERLSNSDNQRRLCIQQQITVRSCPPACNWIEDDIAGIWRRGNWNPLVCIDFCLRRRACGICCRIIITPSLHFILILMRPQGSWDDPRRLKLFIRWVDWSSVIFSSEEQIPNVLHELVILTKPFKPGGFNVPGIYVNRTKEPSNTRISWDC